MSKLVIKSWHGHVLASTDEYDDLAAWARSGNLRQANLREANLRGANLREANLSGADLSGANLREANLRGANLREANLSGAAVCVALFGVVEADLREANLSGADLSGANLREANLSGANLREANLSGADLSLADLSGADLSGVEVVIDGGQDRRGYRVTGWLHNGQLMVKAGCRNFTLAEARAHWGGADYLRDHSAATQAEMLARVELIVTVARARGWRFEDAAPFVA